MSNTELIDVVNEHGEVVSTIARKEAERNNHTTQNVLVFIFNTQGRVWVQLRPKTKSHYPGMWDISACGGVISGETHKQAAKRETLEETGLEVDLHYVESFLNVFAGENCEQRTRLSHLYIGISDGTPQTNEEVDEFKAWEPEDLRADVLQNPNNYIPSFIVELDKAITGCKNLKKLA